MVGESTGAHFSRSQTSTSRWSATPSPPPDTQRSPTTSRPWLRRSGFQVDDRPWPGHGRHPMFMCPIEPQCKFERLILLELARRRACGSRLEPAARKPLTRGFRSEFPIIRVIENGGFGTTGCALGAIRCITMRLRPGSRRPVLRQQYPFDTGRKHEPRPDHAPFWASPPVVGRGARPNWLVFCSARSPHDWGGEVGEPGWWISPTGGVPRCVSTGETPEIFATLASPADNLDFVEVERHQGCLPQ